MYATFVLAMFFATAEASAFTRKELLHGRNTSIEEFYNTTEPVWTYRSRAHDSTNLSCLVDVTVNTTLSDLYFERSFYSNQTRFYRVKMSLTRLLQKGHTHRSSRTLIYDAMRPIHLQKNPLFDEQLLYQSEDNSCGVFKFFKHPNITRFDLRVRNCSLAMEPHENCTLFFNKTADLYISRLEKLKERKVYNPECQAILWKTDGCQ